MAVLSGGGNWLALQKQAIGSTTTGSFVSFEEKVPSSNPAYPPQDVLTLDIEGELKKIGCPTALGRVFQANRVSPGTELAITYEGQKRGKRGTSFHSFKVETLDSSFDPSKMTPANQPSSASNEEAELERRLAEARARRAA